MQRITLARTWNRAMRSWLDAEYTIYNVSKADVYVDDKWIPAGTGASDENKIITLVTDEAGHAETETDYLPYGSYLIKETKAPEGYVLNEDMVFHCPNPGRWQTL